MVRFRFFARQSHGLLAVCLFSLIASTACDRGLADKLTASRDNQFQRGQNELAALEDRRSATFAAMQDLFQVATTVPQQASVLDSLAAATVAMEKIKEVAAKDKKDTKPGEGAAVAKRLKQLVFVARATSEANALSRAVENATRASEVAAQKGKLEQLNNGYAAAFTSPAYRAVWGKYIPRLMNAAKGKCLKACKAGDTACVTACLDTATQTALAGCTTTQQQCATRCAAPNPKGEKPKEADVKKCAEACGAAKAACSKRAFAKAGPSDAAFDKLGKGLSDPWGSPYFFRYPAKKAADDLSFDVCGAGPDKKPNTQDDVCADGGRPNQTLSQFADAIAKSNEDKLAAAKQESMEAKGGQARKLLADIADANLLLGALTGVNFVQRGNHPLLAWRYFASQWDDGPALDVYQNIYRGTPAAGMSAIARAFAKENRDFWEHARNKNMRRMAGTADAYMAFLTNYVKGAVSDIRDACLTGCDRNEAYREDKKGLATCRLACLDKASQTKLAGCEATLKQETGACPAAGGDQESKDAAADCKSRAESKARTCQSTALNAAGPSADAKQAVSKKESLYWVLRPYMTEAAFDEVFFHVAGGYSGANVVPFYAVAFNFPAQGNERPRDFFGRICQQSPDLRDQCRPTPDELRDSAVKGPYLQRVIEASNRFLTAHAKKDTSKAKFKDVDNTEATCVGGCATVPESKREHCRLKCRVDASKGKTKKCRDASTAAAKACPKGAEQAACIKKAMANGATCIQDAFAVTWTANLPEDAKYVNAIAGFESVLRIGLARLPKPVEDPVLPSSFAPKGGASGLTLAFRSNPETDESALGISLQGQNIVKKYDVKAGVNKGLKKKINAKYLALAATGTPGVDYEHIVLEAPGTYTATDVRNLINSFPITGEKKVKTVSLISRRRVDDSMKRVGSNMRRIPVGARPQETYQFPGESKATTCPFMGGIGKFTGYGKNRGHVMVVSASGIDVGTITEKVAESTDTKKKTDEEPKKETVFGAKTRITSLNGLSQIAGWAKARPLSQASVKPTKDSAYQKLTDWAEKNPGPIRLFVPADMSYDVLISLTTALQFTCEDKEVQTSKVILKADGSRAFQKLWLPCRKAKARKVGLYVSICGQ